LVSRRSMPGMLHPWARAGSRRFLAIHPTPLPCSKTRPSRQDLAYGGLADTAPGLPKPKASAGTYLEANTGLQHPLSTLHERRRRLPCKTRSGWRAAPLPGGGRTLWIAAKGFRLHTILLSRTCPVAGWSMPRSRLLGRRPCSPTVALHPPRRHLNHRLISADQTGITFTWKDYRIEGPGGIRP